MCVLAWFVPKLFKIDKVLFVIVAISLGLISWSTFFAANVGFNLKALVNLLLFFMVAYQTFVLFRREQNLLQAKQKELLEQEKDVAIGKTAALLAHDVRRPLEQMSLILNRISAGDVSEGFLRTAKRDVDFSITSVENQINDIMNYGRTKEMTLESISFYKVLSGALKQVLTINQNVKLDLEYNLIANQKIMGDESRLSSVLTNLISNSVEAIRDIGQRKDGLIKFSTGIVNGEFVFKIFNDGPTIPSGILTEIFKPLFTHGKNKGTGLGLASVAKIVREHKGAITAKNIGNSGVEFTTSLKLSHDQDHIPMEEFMLSSGDYTYEKIEINSQKNSRSIRILLLDDDSQVYEYFQFIVKNLDFDVELVFVSEAEKARELVQSKRFDVYILDFDLGTKTTGVDFYHENLSYLSSEVVLHSNRDKAILKNEKCVYEAKPISFDALVMICENAYAKRLKILLVDDSELTLMAWEMFHGKHNIVTANSPKKALECLESGANHFDLCVIDYYFENSKMNGEALALKIRGLMPEIKIVIASNSVIKIEDFLSIPKNAFEVRNL
jgi:signal transduction histidine kinase/CheY-like chemotaxis protein